MLIHQDPKAYDSVHVKYRTQPGNILPFLTTFTFHYTENGVPCYTTVAVSGTRPLLFNFGSQDTAQPLTAADWARKQKEEAQAQAQALTSDPFQLELALEDCF